MSRTRLYKSRIAAFWLGILASIAIPIFIGAWLVPTPQLEELAGHARWGGPLWFGIVGGLVGVLRHRLHEALTSALEGDHWRDLDRRHYGAEFLQGRLDNMLALSLVLGVLSFFVPSGHAVLSGTVADVIAAIPFGAAGYVLWSFALWAGWRRQIDSLCRDLAVSKRKREQAEKQLNRLREDDQSAELKAPKVTTRRVFIRPRDSH